MKTYVDMAAQQYIDQLDAYYEKNGLVGISDYLWALCEADGIELIDLEDADDAVFEELFTTVY